MFAAMQFLKDKFQTPKGLIAFLSSYDAPLPNEAAVDKWFQRGAIPSAWLPVVLAYLEIENGGPVSLISYLERLT